ncbi:MAG: WG repeat-containing protein, partial [Bacteroidia bacterium]
MSINTHQTAFAKVKPNWDFWGLIDINGNYVLDPIYHTIFNWHEGFARLEKVRSKIDVGGDWANHYNGEYGFINANGKLITDFSFGYAKDFSNGLAAVNKYKKWGFIDTNGQTAIPCKFDDVYSFNDDGCIVSLNNKWGLIDRNGNWKLENKFESLLGFSFGLAVASETSQSDINKIHKFIIDINGNKIVDLPDEFNWFMPVSEKLILIGKRSGYPGEAFYGFMDLQGKIKSPARFYTTSDSLFYTGKFVNGKLYAATQDGTRGYVNEEGEFEISNEPQTGNAKVESI